MSGGVWEVVQMDGWTSTHPVLARGPECPPARHPTRDCPCKVFRSTAQAEAYVAERQAAEGAS